MSAGTPQGPGTPIDATRVAPEPTRDLRRERADWTPRYQRDREKILGQHIRISRHAEVAAFELAEHLGGRERAKAWLAEALAALTKGRV